MTEERPVPLFVPPELVPPPAVPVPLPALPTPPPPPTGLLVGVAKVDHSGRVGDRLLITALGWQPDDRTDVEVLPDAAVVRRSPHGQSHVDSRRHVFLPAATRALLNVPIGGRVVLLAVPDQDLLMIHPPDVVAALLVTRYPMIAGVADDP